MKHLTSAQRWFGPLLISVLLILALLQLAAFAAFGGRERGGGEGTSRSVKELATPCGPVNFQLCNSPAAITENSGTGGGIWSTNAWNVTINSLTSTPYAGHYLLVVDASFTNISSGEQTLGPAVFAVTDNEGQQYSSSPGQPFTVEPNQTIETRTAFVVPDSGCNSTLTFIGDSNGDRLQWTIICK